MRRYNCFGRNFSGRPGEKRTRNPFSPPRRRAWYQRITELAPQPMRRAASWSEQPESTKAKGSPTPVFQKIGTSFGSGHRCSGGEAEHLDYWILLRGTLLAYLYYAPVGRAGFYRWLQMQAPVEEEMEVRALLQ